MDVPASAAEDLITSALWFQDQGGPSVGSYWQDTTNRRDEYLVILNSMLTAMVFAGKAEFVQEDFDRFSGAFMLLTKAQAQSAVAVDVLLEAGCPLDAMVIGRAMLSRAMLIVLFAFEPDLFDDWLNMGATARAFKDAAVRKRVREHGVDPLHHIYSEASDFVHSRYDVVGNDLLTSGMLGATGPSQNRAYCLAGTACALGTTAAIDMLSLAGATGVLPNISALSELYETWAQSALSANRLENLPVALAEHRGELVCGLLDVQEVRQALRRRWGRGL